MKGFDGEAEVLCEGKADCNHAHLNYVAVPLDGQAFWCDDCARQERVLYSKDRPNAPVMTFPPGSLVRVPNPQYGGEDVYAFRTDSEGKLQLLASEKRVRRADVSALVSA